MGGPSSLTVARDLSLIGYEIHLYDDQAKGGGDAQRNSFRLPEEVIEEEVNQILQYGIHAHFNTYIDSLKQFVKKIMMLFL